jgi:SNF2 family DNA or RNA helicase
VTSSDGDDGGEEADTAMLAAEGPNGGLPAGGSLDDEDDFSPGGASDPDEEDDEATLAEEEAAAAAEGEQDGEAEAAALRDEANMPLAELLKRYGVPEQPQAQAHAAPRPAAAGASAAGGGSAQPMAPPASAPHRRVWSPQPPPPPLPASATPRDVAFDGPQWTQHVTGPGIVHTNPYEGAARVNAPVPPPPPRPVPAPWRPPTWQASAPVELTGDEAVAQAQLCARLAAQREAEDTLVLRGADLRDEARARAATFGAEPSAWEPFFRPAEVSRSRTHWDHLLEEMAWLAKDSDRERKWKRKQARKAATACKGSGKDIASKAAAAAAAEVAAIRAVASLCAREVRVFWGKAEKLVRIQAQQKVEQRRQADMDKHLQFVVAQTERYAALVATKLTGEAAAGTGGGSAGAGPSDPGRRHAVPPAASPAPDDDDVMFDPEGPEETDDEATLEEEEAAAAAAGDDSAHELAALAADMDAPLEELLPPEVLARYRGEAAPSPGDVAGGGDATSSDGEEEEDDDESVHLSDEEPEDVDDTLQAELAEAAARGEDGEDAAAAELASLNADADLPLEELLARYGGAGAMEVDEAEASEGASEGSEGSDRDDDESSDEEDGAGGQTAWAKMLLSTPQAAPGAAQAAEADAAEAGRQGLEAVAAHAASAAAGSTRTPVPFLLRAQLRDYQRDGLDWLVALHDRQLNGILADEMVRALCIGGAWLSTTTCFPNIPPSIRQGLGKTIQTISLLAHLACARGVWGPHLVVVPTSVMLNWEAEFKRFCPALKLLVYYGTAKERKVKRQGWSKANAFHVCITSYTLVTQDAAVFRRKKWKYLILDEAHMIKNWRSLRWQTLLNFHTKRRLLLTGTPLQNDLMELWSLMHFLMPHVFASHADFRAWFSQPLSASVEAGAAPANTQLVARLHGVLRPFLLRRLKADVEKSLPGKSEHVVHCSLSKRQRRLYEEYMQCSSTQGTLASGNLLGIMNVLMQLRKVCNHPDLFEGRPIISPLDWTWDAAEPRHQLRLPALVAALAAKQAPWEGPLGGGLAEGHLIALDLHHPAQLPPLAASACLAASPSRQLVQELVESAGRQPHRRVFRQRGSAVAEAEVTLFAAAQQAAQSVWRRARIDALAELTTRRLAALADGAASGARVLASPAGGTSLRALLTVRTPASAVVAASADPGRVWAFTSHLRAVVTTPTERAAGMEELLCATVFAIPRVRAFPPAPWASACLSRQRAAGERLRTGVVSQLLPQLAPVHTSLVRRQVFFPDRRLLQFDSGKLQELAELLLKLKAGGHRCLIFTQMTKMLDVLASFLNLYGHAYCRLDGSTKAEQRQILMQRFNTDARLFCFILTTRAGGFGLNLTGADTVIFYDSDWNPQIDAQAQDRAHRIGQTRPVRIYRLICAQTVEENILKKAIQKRQLDWMAIQSGHFSTQQLTQQTQAAGGAGPAGPGGFSLDPREFFDGLATVAAAAPAPGGAGQRAAPTAAELAAAMRGAEDDADVAAAVAEEQAAQQEVAEFAEELRPVAEEDDDDAAEEAGGAAVAPAPPVARRSEAEEERRAAAQQAAAQAQADAAQAAALAAAAAAEEDDMLADVAKVTAKATQAGGSLLDALSPVERYALRFVENHMPPVLPFGAGADPGAGGEEPVQDEGQWAPEVLEQRKAQHEAACEEEDDHLAVTDWDPAAATAAYERQLGLARQQAEEAAAAKAQQDAQRRAKEARRAALQLAAEEAAAVRAAAHADRAAAMAVAAANAQLLSPAPEPVKLKVKLSVDAAPEEPRGMLFSREEVDLGTSRSGRKRKPNLPGGSDELYAMPFSARPKVPRLAEGPPQMDNPEDVPPDPDLM